MKRIVAKVIVIPYYLINNQKHLLTLKDKRYNEWTFLSGTVEKNESFEETAMRELEEETKFGISINLKDYQYKTMDIIIDHPKFANTDLFYKVFMINISSYNRTPDKVIDMFYSSRLNGRIYNENSCISFETINSFSNKPRIWSFIKKSILNNPFFNILVNA